VDHNNLQLKHEVLRLLMGWCVRRREFDRQRTHVHVVQLTVGVDVAPSVADLRPLLDEVGPSARPTDEELDRA